MDDFTTELMSAIANKKNLKEIIRRRLEDAINRLLERELTVFLDYEKWDVEAKDTENKRNGYYYRDFKTEYGVLHLRICRDSLGEF